MFFLVLLRKVRNDMKGWAVSDAGDKWIVRLDVRDLGGHLDSTLRARAAALGYRISAAVPRVHSVAVLPLDFCGRLRIFCTTHLPAALHGVEASLLTLSLVCASSGLLFGQAAMSGGLRLANPGAVLSLLVGSMLSGVAFGCCVGTWHTILVFMNWLGSVVFFGLSLPVLLGTVRFTFCCPVVRLLVFLGTRIHVFGLGLVCLLFASSPVFFSFFARLFGMLGELRLLGGVWNGFLLGFVRGEIVPCRFCGGPDSDGHLFWSVPILPFFIFMRVLNFMICCFWIGVLGLGVFLGMVGCLLLLGVLRMMTLLMPGWRACGVLTLRVFVESGFLLIKFLIVLLLLMFLIILMCGLLAVL